MFTKPHSDGGGEVSTCPSASTTTQKACQKPLPPLPQPWGSRVRGQGLGKASTPASITPAACLGILFLKITKSRMSDSQQGRDRGSAWWEPPWKPEAKTDPTPRATTVQQHLATQPNDKTRGGHGDTLWWAQDLGD